MVSAKGESLRAFNHYNFRLFWSANLISNTGTWAARIAQDWLVVHDLHRGGSELGVVSALQFLPAFFLSMHGGVLADKFQKRKLLILTNIGGGLSSLIIGLLVISHKITLVEVFALAFISGIFSAVDSPVRQSFNSEVVSKENMANAISLNSANFNTGRIVGPAISGLLIQAFHTGPSFLINAASFIFVILALLMMRKSELNLAPTKERAPISEALKYIWSRKDLVAVMSTVFFAATFGLNFQIFNTLLATKTFHKSAGAYGLLGTYLAIGSLTAAIFSARTEKFRRPKRISQFASIFGLALAILALAPSYLVYSIGLPLVGFVALTTMINANTYVQTTTKNHLRGRVMGVYLFIFLGTSPVGSLMIGYLTDAIGIRETIIFCGVVTFLGSALAYRVLNQKIIEHSISE